MDRTEIDEIVDEEISRFLDEFRRTRWTEARCERAYQAALSELEDLHLDAAAVLEGADADTADPVVRALAADYAERGVSPAMCREHARALQCAGWETQRRLRRLERPRSAPTPRRMVVPTGAARTRSSRRRPPAIAGPPAHDSGGGDEPPPRSSRRAKRRGVSHG